MPMAATARPVSLIQPSVSPRPSSSLFSSNTDPLRRSVSPPGPGHYTLRRFSYISELPSEQDFVLSRPRSILRSGSFSMGFGFKERGKEKEKELTAKTDSTTSSTPPTHPTPSLRSAFIPTIQVNDRPSSSHGLFSRHKPKGLKKKRSLASLLETSASEASVSGTSLAPPQVTRAHSSDAATALTVLPSLSTSKGKTTKPLSEQDLRREEYRQLQGPKPKATRGKKTIWAKRHNMKVHTQSQAVYMQAYDPIILENDRHMDILLRRLNAAENPSFHDYSRKAPFHVLDLGCGPGHWLLEAAHYWTQCAMTGFDMVDILIPEARERNNIHFVQGNFLRPWPIPSKSFDLVRIANLSLCIPYDKWEMVLGEAHRVLTIDGRVEMIDDQIFFPYSPPPVTRPASIYLPSDPAAAPVEKVISTVDPIPALSKGVSFFDMDDVGEEEDDVDSVNTDSTLVSSDGDISPTSPLEKQTQSSPSDPDAHSLLRPLPTMPAPGAHSLLCPLPVIPASLTPEVPSTPTSATTIKPCDVAPPTEWSLNVGACRDLETVFQQMLHNRYGIHSHPSQFIINVMQHVFGNGEKLKSFHLKLAPKDAEKDFTLYESGSATGSSEGSEKEEKSVSEPKKVGQRINEMRKPWFRSSTPTTESPTPIPDNVNPKAAGRLGIREDIPKVVSRVPENVSAKAAHRLGIPMANERKSDESFRSSSSNSTTPDNSSPLSSSSPTSKRDSLGSVSGSSTESRISAKAAHRLGISYSALTEAAASAKASTRRPQSSQSTLIVNHLPVQSPGLIVWPSKFIPLPPVELEMHACKNVHTLIGCKPALVEYIGVFHDQYGNRIEGDEEFDHAMWDYECFRRRRFNWPSETTTWDVDHDNDPALESTTPTSSPESFVLPPTHSYKHDDLTHVRTIRVYEAIKTGEYSLSTLHHPRSPPPSPPQ